MRPAAAVFAAISIAACRHPTADVRVADDATPAPATPPSTVPSTAASSSATPSTDPPPATFASTSLSAKTSDKPYCYVIAPGGEFPGNFLSAHDLSTSFVDGDDLLALVNRAPTGALPPDYAPSDLVQVFSGQPASAHACETRVGPCMRKDAAAAMRELLSAMSKKGLTGEILSAFRSYDGQCATFEQWAKKEGSEFCGAVNQSALAGHSQHQLGTTVDLFTNDWIKDGKDQSTGTFRNGFGCTYGGKWIAEHAWEHGFVVPYPLHPDDRQSIDACLQRWDWPVPANPKTGYKQEPWHIRFVGIGNAKAFHEAWLASGPGAPDEITLEQWLRAKQARAGDAELPVCDGCQCEACATLNAGEKKAHPCGDDALWIDEHGQPMAGEGEPTILDVRFGTARKEGTVVEVRVSVPPHTLTQPPVISSSAPPYADGTTFDGYVPMRKTGPHRYDDLPHTWRLAVEPAGDAGGTRWPWRSSLAHTALGRTYNRANLVLPAIRGEAWFSMTIATDAKGFRVTLLRDGEEHGTRELGR
jgi:D-alanyl-D-alanine carboxypeptidase